METYKLYQQQELLERDFKTLEHKLISDILELQKEFNEPYYIFVQKDEIKNNLPYYHFIIYELGRHKPIIWGIYDKLKEQIHVDDGCIYNVMRIGKYHKVLNTQFVLVNSVVKNRIRTTINDYLGKHSGYPEDYHQYKMMKAFVKFLDTDDFSIIDMIQNEDDIYRSDNMIQGKYKNSIFDIILEQYDLSDDKTNERYYDKYDELFDDEQYDFERINRINDLKEDIKLYEKRLNLSMKEIKNNKELDKFISNVYIFMNRYNIGKIYDKSCANELFQEEDFMIKYSRDKPLNKNTKSKFYSSLPDKYIEQDMR